MNAEVCLKKGEQDTDLFDAELPSEEAGVQVNLGIVFRKAIPYENYDPQTIAKSRLTQWKREIQ